MATESTRVDVRERRSFSVEDKRRIVAAYRAAIVSGEGGGVVLRREGIYQSLVFKWGQQIDDGTLVARRRLVRIRPRSGSASSKNSCSVPAARSTRWKSW
jgi:transposase-like protein